MKPPRCRYAQKSICVDCVNQYKRTDFTLSKINGDLRRVFVTSLSVPKSLVKGMAVLCKYIRNDSILPTGPTINQTTNPYTIMD